jgi:prevent-host-death family protein
MVVIVIIMADTGGHFAEQLGKGLTMKDISADYLRKHLGEVLDKAFYTGAEVRINRKNKCLGVFVPIELYERRRQVYSETFLRFMEERRAAGSGEDYSDEQIMDDAVAAVNAVRGSAPARND